MMIKGIKKNVIANYIGQFYIALIGIFIVPYYLAVLGSEGVGLVSFFSMLQAILQLFDIGMSTTLNREAAKSKISSENALYFVRFQKLITITFVIIAFLFLILSMSISNYIAKNWLDSNLDNSLLETCLIFIFITVAIRWQAAPWRSSLMGLGYQIPVNILNVFIATFRFPGALLVLHFYDAALVAFFSYQVIVGALELVSLYIMNSYYSPWKSKIPPLNLNFIIGSKETFKFAFGASFTAIIWILVTQLDKFILSSTIPLASYGYFSMAVMAAGGITILSQPLSQALLPKLSGLVEKKLFTDVNHLYLDSTSFISIIIFPIGMFLGFFSEEVSLLWTGDIKASDNIAPILTWYAWGNMILALSCFPYFLQIAYGNLKLHIIGNIIFLVVLIPSIALASLYYGALGASKVWFFQNLLYFVFWTKVVHNRFLKDLHLDWLLKKILPYFMLTLLILIISNFIVEFFNEFTSQIVGIIIFAVMAVFSNYGMSRTLKHKGY